MSLPNGIATLDIEGTLQDIINNFNTLISDLKAQGIDPSFLQKAQVTIHSEVDDVPPATFNSGQTAITAWRTTISSTSIQVQLRFQVKG